MNHSNKIIISLLTANLLATIWFGVSSNSPQSNQKPFEQAANHELPKVITDDIKEDILQRFKAFFNSQDYEGLYNMFGSVAKAQIPREKMDVEFKKLTNIFHSIEDGSYNYAEFLQRQGGTTVYILHYAVQLSEQSTIGNTGNLKIMIAIEGNNYQIYGIRLFSEP